MSLAQRTATARHHAVVRYAPLPHLSFKQAYWDEQRLRVEVTTRSTSSLTDFAFLRWLTIPYIGYMALNTMFSSFLKILEFLMNCSTRCTLAFYNFGFRWEIMLNIECINFPRYFIDRVDYFFRWGTDKRTEGQTDMKSEIVIQILKLWRSKDLIFRKTRNVLSHHNKIWPLCWLFFQWSWLTFKYRTHGSI